MAPSIAAVMLKYRLKRIIRLLTPHRRTLFGIKRLRVSYVFAAVYVAMAVGALVGEPLVAGAAYAFSGWIEERDIMPKNRRKRKLSGWRRGLEIRSQWRTLLFIGAMVAGSAATELTVSFVVISLLATLMIRVIRSRQLQLDTRRRLTALGALEAGKERLSEAKSVARKRDLAELPVQIAVAVAAFLVSLPTASGMANWAAIVLASLAFAAVVAYVFSLIQRIRRVRPALLSGQHDSEVLSEFLAYDPEVICYFNGHRGSMYAVNVWLRTFEAASKRVALVFRHRDVRSVGTEHLPGIVVTRDALCEKVVAPSTRIALYPTNGTLNIHMQRDPRLGHVFIGHGDSDKAGSASPATRSYDRIWVSGAAGRERYQTADLDIPDDQFDIVGRPPLSAAVRAAEEARLVPEEGESPLERLQAALAEADAEGAPPFTILYAPTWEGYFDKSDYSSVANIAVPLIESLLEKYPGVRIIYKPHPMGGRRLGRIRSASGAIRRMLAADENAFHPSTGSHSRVSLYQWFDLADLLITDISSVLSDFMVWDRPYVVTNPRQLPIGELHQKFPTTKAAYVIDGVDPAVDVLLIDNALTHDPLADRRHDAREHFLGDPNRDPLDMFNEQLDSLWQQQGPHPVDDETLILMGLKEPHSDTDDATEAAEDTESEGGSDPKLVSEDA